MTIALSISGLPSLSLSQVLAGNEDFVTRSSVEAFGVGDRTATGADTVVGSGLQYFVWSFQTIVDRDSLLLFDEMRALQQNRYASLADGQIILTDQRFWVSTAEVSRGLRSSVGSALTAWGGTIYYISCPVFIRIPENHSRQIAENMYYLIFDAKELTR